MLLCYQAVEEDQDEVVVEAAVVAVMGEEDMDVEHNIMQQAPRGLEWLKT